MSQKNEHTTQPAKERTYTTHPDFQGIFPELLPKQYAALKASIRKEGVRDPLVVWDRESIHKEDILLDGHHRNKICDELGIKPPIRRMSFDDKEQAKMWVVQNQFTRRNMTPFQRIEAALQFEKHYAAQAQANQHGGVRLNSTEGGNVNGKIAKLANTSPDTVKKVKKILAKKHVPEIAEKINDLRSDEPGVSIHSVHAMVCEMDDTKKDSKKSNPKPTRQASSKEVEVQVNTTMSSLNSLEQKLSEPNDRLYFYDKVIEWAKARKQAKKPTASTQQK